MKEVERLQNTLAHQRLSQSRTSLDDSEYTNRFDRLDGAIKNVAFEIRQSWKGIPQWLHPVTNQSAEIKGGREMTYVGRASISRWVVLEIFEMFFHPGLDAELSMHLKAIERNIKRGSSHDFQSIEEDNALSTKVCNWRLTTLDALRPELVSPLGAELKERLTHHLVEKLVAELQKYLNEPAPPGLLGGVSMIIDIAVGLASHLPLESRDVRVWYPTPGSPFDGKYMKIDGTLPPLVAPIVDIHAQQQQLPPQIDDPAQQGADKSLMDIDPQGEENGKDQGKPGGVGNGPVMPGGIANAPVPGPKSEKRGLSGRFRQLREGRDAAGKMAPPGGPVAGQLQPGPGQPPQLVKGGSQVSLQQDPQQQMQQMQQMQQHVKDEQKFVRIAGFMAVEVRGRAILVKAPVIL